MSVAVLEAASVSSAQSALRGVLKCILTQSCLMQTNDFEAILASSVRSAMRSEGHSDLTSSYASNAVGVSFPLSLMISSLHHSPRMPSGNVESVLHSVRCLPGNCQQERIANSACVMLGLEDSTCEVED